jgi:hypothetical protein
MATSRRKNDTMQRGEIHLGDLIRALGTLHGQEDEHAQAIAGCLGFGLAAPEVQPARPTPTVYDRSRLSPQAKSEAPATPRQAGLAAPPTRAPQIDLPAQTLKSTLNAVAAPPAIDTAEAPTLAHGRLPASRTRAGRFPAAPDADSRRDRPRRVHRRPGDAAPG